MHDFRIVPARRRRAGSLCARRRARAEELACFLLILCLGAGAAAAGPGSAAATGPELIHAGGGSEDVVCIAVAVPVGSACESSGMRGASHFIEHLVFDGSERFSREEMSRWVDDAGAFLNAFTRTETTVYMLVVSSPLFEEGLELLSQMLLHSVFPAAEIEKERGVILEEIRRERDDPRAARERLAAGVLYRGSALAEPVIGYPATIEGMDPRDLRAFYRRHYRPSRMRIVLMGGYDAARAERLIGDCFGGPPAAVRVGGPRARARPAEGPGTCGGPAVPRWRNEIVARDGAAGETEFDILVRLPGVQDRDFASALLAARLLEADDSPLARKAAALSLPAPEVRFEISAGFSALRIQVKCPDSLAEACRAVPGIVGALAAWRPAAASIRKAQRALLAAQTFDREMYHFYMMLHGEAIALHGARYMEQTTEGIANVTEDSCARVLSGWLREPAWNACLIAQGPAALTAAAPAGGAPLVEDLPGGGSIGVATRAGSAAAAVHLLLRGRSCAGDRGAPGLVELLLGVLEFSPEGAKLAESLEALGARVAYGDNPYVPMDDYLLNPSFAFIRLEAPADVVEEAASLLGAHLAGAVLSEAALETARTALMGELGMRSGSPYYMLRSAMMKSLFGEHPYASPLFPPPPAMSRATAAALDTLRRRLFARGNIIATIVSPLERPAARAIVTGLVDRFPAGPAVACPPFPEAGAAQAVERAIRKEGAYLAAGWILRCGGPSQTAAAIAAGEVLARRMQLELREKRGLAYTIDCSVAPCPGGAVVMAYLGTGADRLDEAQAALEREVRDLGERPAADEEIATAARRLVGARARSQLSSINAAYALGFDMLLGGTDGFEPLGAAIAAADPEAVREVVRRFLTWDGASIVRLVPESKSR